MKIILRCQFRFRKKTHDRFPTLNEYIDCERGSTIAAAAMKKNAPSRLKNNAFHSRYNQLMEKWIYCLSGTLQPGMILTM